MSRGRKTDRNIPGMFSDKDHRDMLPFDYIRKISDIKMREKMLKSMNGIHILSSKSRVGR